MDTLREHIKEATHVIREHTALEPLIGIIPAAGMGSLADYLKVTTRIPYCQLPHFPNNSRIAPELILGYLGAKAVVVLSGHFPYNEVGTLQQAVFPVRVAKSMGIQALVIANRACSVNPAIMPGDLIVITDHVNLLGDNPLIGPNDDGLGPRFPDMRESYDRGFIQLAETIATESGIKLGRGVFVAWNGLFEEAEAEGRFLRNIGGDVVGKDTVPEVIVGVHAGLKVLGFSIIAQKWPADRQNSPAVKTDAEMGRADSRWVKMATGCVARISG